MGFLDSFGRDNDELIWIIIVVVVLLFLLGDRD
jgi:flagellar basal body-associated protein FliL